MAKKYKSLYGNIYNLLGVGSLGSHNLLKWPCFSKVNSHDSKCYTVVVIKSEILFIENLIVF